MAEGRHGVAGIRLGPPGPHAAARISAIRLLRHFLAAACSAAFSFRLVLSCFSPCLILFRGGSRVRRYGSCRLPRCWPLRAAPLCALVPAAGACGAGRFSCSRRVNGHG